MKRLQKSFFYQLLGIGTLGLIVALPIINHLPAIANPNPFNIIAQAKKPEIILNLAVAKKTIEVTVDGDKEVRWQDLGNSPTVAPGDVLRYTVKGENTGSSPAENLAITQPIPRQMTYKIGSAASLDGAEITYSIDNGETFVPSPKIKIKEEDAVVERPAPPEAYTHIRWKFDSVSPEKITTATYEVRVQ